MLNKLYLKDIGRLLFGSVTAQIMALLFMPIITRLYTPAQFGLYSYQVQIAIAMGLFITFRLEHVLQLPNTKKNVTALFQFISVLSVLIFLILILVLIFLSIILDTQLLGLSIFELVSCVFLGFLIVSNSSSQGLIQWNQKYSISGYGEIVNKASYILFSVSSIRIFEFYNLVFGHILGLISKQYLYVYTINPYKGMNWNTLYRGYFLAKKLRSLASSVLISHIFLVVTTVTPLYLIKELFTDEILGFYTLTIGTLFLPTMLISIAVGSVYFERGIKISSSKESFMQHWFKTVSMCISLSIPIFLVPLFFGEQIYSLFFGEEWLSSGTIAKVMRIPAMIGFISSAVDRTCIIAKNVYYGPIWHMVRAITTVILCLFVKIEGIAFIDFIVLISAQMTLLYIADLVFQFRFAYYIGKHYG